MTQPGMALAAGKDSMFEFTESIDIHTDLDRAWIFLIDAGHWWRPSNPEHESLEILDEEAQTLTPGSRLRIRERIAGIPGEAVGVVTERVDKDRITWQASAWPPPTCGAPLASTESC